jgi:hypothetical protein
MKSWEWYDDSKTVHVFLTLLLSANREDKEWKSRVIKRGQLVTGRKKLAATTGLSEQSVRTALGKLIATKEITINPTNKFTIITVVNWDTYQTTDSGTNQRINQRVNQRINHKQEVEKSLVDTNVSTRHQNGDDPPAKKDYCPHKDILEIYHRALPELPSVKIWDETRQSHLRARWNQKYQTPGGKVSNTVDFWESFFKYVRESDFLMGQTKSRNGNKPFRAALPWMVQKSNFANIVEGKYH